VASALAYNVSKNGLDSRVTILKIALGDSNGIVSFHEAEDSTMGSLAVDGYQSQPGKVIQVPCRTLDSIVEELNLKPDFLKIDVEGFAHLVLRGASEVISKFRPRLVVEVNLGDPCAPISDVLSKCGYEFYNIATNGLERRQEIVALDAYPNWLCVPALVGQKYDAL
jgi:FkbM family methyltransferase